MNWGVAPEEYMRLSDLQILHHPELQRVEGSSKSFHYIHSHVHILPFLKIMPPAIPKCIRIVLLLISIYSIIMQKFIRVYGFILIPPMASAENQKVCSYPLGRKPVELINSDNSTDLFRCSLRRSIDDYEVWHSEILQCEIEFLKFDGEEAFVLCYWVPILFIYCGLIGNPLSEHTYQRFPLVSAYGVPGEHDTPVPAAFQKVLCIKPAIENICYIQ